MIETASFRHDERVHDEAATSGGYLPAEVVIPAESVIPVAEFPAEVLSTNCLLADGRILSANELLAAGGVISGENIAHASSGEDASASFVYRDYFDLDDSDTQYQV